MKKPLQDEETKFEDGQVLINTKEEKKADEEEETIVLANLS